ncbi:hypothetical protein JCM19241_5351 [Vibrio ishigakensis]|uniref:Uncharacterized protein n=1 Tax=Vibrio ishigakensis TaxID=1481914 RepID=A0A0B8Q3F5_9VIBR|nr:hypothetical protein JCM19241_5351 [Vibrio ishigakensis]
MKNFAMTCGLVAISSAVLVGCDSDENSAQTPPPVPEQKARWVQGICMFTLRHLMVISWYSPS